MGINTFSPVVPEKAKDILLTEGVLYKDFGEAGQAIIGATQGGSTLEIDWTKKIVEHDGMLGPAKGMRKTEMFFSKLTINFLKVTYVNMAYGLNVLVEDGSDADGTFKKLTFKTSFSSTDVLDNVTYVGYKADGSYCHIKLLNALNIDPISFVFKEKSSVIPPMIYTGFYPYSTPTTPPLLLNEEIPT